MLRTFLTNEQVQGLLDFKGKRMNFRILILAVLVLFQLGCDNESQKGKDSVIRPLSYKGVNTASLVDELEDLDRAISLGQVLQNNSQRRRPQIVSAIENARAGVLLLGLKDVTSKQEKDAFSLFTSALGQYESYGILDFEQDRFERVFNRVRELRSLLIDKAGIEDTGWVIYNNNFADGLEPEFQTFAERGDDVWVTNFQIDQPKAKVQARNGKAWLISRPFDISNIEQPSFRYFTSYLVVAPNPILTLPEVIQAVFKTYVILDMKPGESIRDVDKSRIIQIKYDNNNLPLGEDFHDEWVPLKSLEKYRDHKVSIAFLFDTTTLKEQQYHGWTIFDFELHGFGILKKQPIKTVASLHSYNSLSLNFGGEIWKKQPKANGISVSAGVEKTDAFLLSPLYVLPSDAQAPKLIINESIKGLDFGEAELLISENYKGGKNPLDASVQWTVLDSRFELFEDREFAYDLADYIGKSFVIGFRFKSAPEKDFSWSINKLFIESLTANVIEAPYNSPDLDQKYVVHTDTFKDKKFKTVYEDEELSPKWKVRKESIGISGFVRGGDPKTGLSRLILNEADLRSVIKPRVRIRQTMKHVKDLASLSVQVRLSCVGSDDFCENAWEPVQFPTGTFQQFVDDPTTSSWVLLDEKYHNQKIEFSLVYKASKKSTPAWDFINLQVGGVKQ